MENSPVSLLLQQLFIVKFLGCLGFAMLPLSVNIMDVTILQKDLFLT
jgi:hypothetical protein